MKTTTQHLARAAALTTAAALAASGAAFGASGVAADTPTPSPVATPAATASPSAQPAPSATAKPMASTPVATTPAATPANCAAQTTIPTLCVTLNDADASHDTQAYLDASKDNTVASTIGITDPQDASHAVVGLQGQANGEIKGRGNYTWTLAKKPYQIKFASKTSVLGLPASKKWVLLANHADPSLMRNMVALTLANKLGMQNAPEFRFVDLVVNGQYRGNYLLTEKVEVGANRVELTDPQGVLVEQDNNYGTDEPFHFTTATSGQTFALKDAAGKGGVPDDAATAMSPDVQAGWSDVQATINKVDALLAAKNPDWSAISALIDVDSFVRYYWVNELTENPEITQSSIYFYKNGVGDKLHIGPAWDYDSSLRNYDFEANGSDPVSEYTKNAFTLRKPIVTDRKRSPWYQDLFRNPQFVAAANSFEPTAKSALDALVPSIDATKGAIAPSASKNFARWTDVLGKSTVFRTYASTWDAEVARLRSFTANRVAFLESAYGQNFPIVTTQSSTKTRGFTYPGGVQTGQIAGYPGEGLSLDQLNISVSGTTLSGGIEANPHQSSTGWWGWQPAGHFLGTTNSGKQLEALQLRLTGDLATYFTVSYRGKVQGTSTWGAWTTNGGTIGTTGAGKGLEAVQVRLLLKPGKTLPGGSVTPTTPTQPTNPPTTPTQPTNPPTTPTPAVSSHVSYSAHVQNVGWQAAVSDGALAGTTGKSLRLEAFKLSESSNTYAGGITYRAHVQDVGWQGWVSNGAVAGTTLQGKRLEAFEVKLTGAMAQHYTVQYRAYVQDAGWKSWVSDGATAGTIGQSKRVEAIEVRLVAK